MNSTCPTCGGPLEPDKPCPRCLLKAAMGDTARTPPGGASSVEAAPTVKSPLPVAQDTLPLAPLRGLEILEPLGRGGMGQVYRARQIELNRVVAVKILPPRLAEDPEFLERFRREAQALAALDHPNIVRVFDCGAQAGQTYIVMEFVDGPNLRDLMRKGLKPEEALALVPPICEALEYAHGEGVVHRDIKPENILIDKKGRVKIADFGLAKILRTHGEGLTQTREVMGTPHYMAPEQFERPKEVDHRADIYALGVVVYEMLTGELPIGRFQPPSQRVQVDVRLDEVVLKALEKDPGRRYQRASEMNSEVTRVSTPLPRGPVRSDAPRPEPAMLAPPARTSSLPPALRKRVAIVCSIAVLAGVILNIIGLATGSRDWQTFSVVVIVGPILTAAILVAIQVLFASAAARQAAEGARGSAGGAGRGADSALTQPPSSSSGPSAPRPWGTNLVLWATIPFLAILLVVVARILLLTRTSWAYRLGEGEGLAMTGAAALGLGISFLSPAFRRFLARWRITVPIAVAAIVLTYLFTHAPREDLNTLPATCESRVLWRRALPGLPADLRFAVLTATGSSLYLSVPDGIREFDRAAGDAVGQWEATARLDPPVRSENLLVWTDGDQICVQDSDRRPLKPRVYGFKISGLGLAPPAVQKGIAYGGGSGLAYAMDLASGELKWQEATSIPILAPPAIFARDVTFFHDDGSVFSVERLGAAGTSTAGSGRINNVPARRYKGPPVACGDVWALPVEVLFQPSGVVNAPNASLRDGIEFFSAFKESLGTVTLNQGERIFGTTSVYTDDTLVFCAQDSVVGMAISTRCVPWRCQTGKVEAGPVEVGNGYVAVHSTMSRSGIYVIRCKSGEISGAAYDDLLDTRALAAFDRTVYALDRGEGGAWRLTAVSLGLGGPPDPPAKAATAPAISREALLGDWSSSTSPELSHEVTTMRFLDSGEVRGGGVLLVQGHPLTTKVDGKEEILRAAWSGSWELKDSTLHIAVTTSNIPSLELEPVDWKIVELTAKRLVMERPGDRLTLFKLP